MNAADTKARCLLIARAECDDLELPSVTKRIADVIAAIPVESDPRDAQIAELTKQRAELAVSEARYAALQNRDAQILSLAAENRALKAQIAALGEALKPFKKLADEVDLCRDGGRPEDWSMACKWHDLVRARSALAASEPKGEAQEAGTVCLSGLASNDPCQPDDTLKRCTICGFVVDTKFKAELPK